MSNRFILFAFYCRNMHYACVYFQGFNAKKVFIVMYNIEFIMTGTHANMKKIVSFFGRECQVVMLQFPNVHTQLIWRTLKDWNLVALF